MAFLKRIARLASALPPTLLAICVATGVIGCGQAVRRGLPPGPAPPPNLSSRFPATLANVHLGLAFDYQGHDPGALARSVDYIFGGAFVDWNLGPELPVGHVDSYLPFDTDAYPQIIRGHSLQSWQAKHPDWIVYRCDRTTPAYYGLGNTNVPLDFSNPAVQAYEAREAAATLAQGARGVAFDDFTFANFEGRCGVYRNGVWTSLSYPGREQDSAKYTDDMLHWLWNVRELLRKQFPTKTFAVSMNFRLSGKDKVRLIAPYVDMVFDEGGFTGYGAQDLTDSAWQQEVDALEDLNARGKAFDVNGIVNAASDASVTHAQINWVLANYLLVKGLHSYTYIYAGDRTGYTGSPSTYGTFYDRPQYHIPIGRPTSSRFQASGVQLRYYSGGLVIVNPSSSHTFTVPLGAPYRDMWGHTYSTTVTLAPATAIVLLNGAS
jgi:Hypothetical glycosyl hydrolase family 15